MTTDTGRARLASGPGSYLRWPGGGTAALEEFAAGRWIGPDGDGNALIRGTDGTAHVLRPGWRLFRPDGQDRVIVIAADVWEAWAREA